MAAVTYPTTLPAPSQWQGVPRERRAASSSPGNTQLRNRSRDAMQDIDAQWFYTSAEMVIWRAWYEATLLTGMLWFAVTVPGAGGWIERVVRYRTKTLKLEYVGNGVYRVSAQVQQRGLSAAPTVADPPPSSHFGISGGGSSLVVSAAGIGAGSVSAPGNSLVMPPGIVAGDGLIAFIMHGGGAEAVTFTDGWADDSILDWALSGGAPRTQFFLRTATGTAADNLAGFTVSGAGSNGPTMFLVVALRGIADPKWSSTFTRGSSGSDANQYGTGVLKPAGDHMLLTFYSMIATDSVGHAELPATGYQPSDTEPLALLTGSFALSPHPAAFFAQIGCAYKAYNGTAGDTGAWNDGTGAYGSGGNSCWEFAITYTP